MASSYKPVALYGLEVQANDEPLHVFEGTEFPATIRLTMAALDPTSPAEDGVDADTPPRATLKMIRIRDDPEDDEFDDDDDEDSDDDDELGLEDLLDDSDDDDDEVNGGPSDPAKSPKAQKKAALAKLRKALAAGAEDDMELDDEPKDKKGKARAAPDDDEEDDEDDSEDSEDDDDFETEEFVLCTLDPLKNYQQPLDIVINEHETVLFQVIGTHNIHLTGNILLPDEDDMPRYPGLDEEDDEELDYDSEEDELDLLEDAEYDESDELDDLDDPRIAELDSDEEAEVPKLIPTKGKNKRAAEEDSELEATLANGVPEEPKLSKNQLKKQRKKLRDNEGNAVDVTATATPNGVKVTADKETPDSKEKKSVAFAKNLVQGPTNGATTTAAPAKAASGPKVVQGVTVDDKKVGTGPAAKKGNKISMRYIGKLDTNKKVFDSNKKGAPFTFKLGSGEVIKGWDIGIAGMQVGGERRITVPANLAYGASGAPPNIPKNATLVFDLKLLEIR